MVKLKYLKARLSSNIERADRSIAQFQERMAKDINHAFRWADDAMQAASVRYVNAMFLKMVTDWEALRDAGELTDRHPVDEDAVVLRVKEYATKTALDKGRSPSQSSSMCANAMERYELAAYSDLVADWAFME